MTDDGLAGKLNKRLGYYFGNFLSKAISEDGWRGVLAEASDEARAHFAEEIEKVKGEEIFAQNARLHAQLAAQAAEIARLEALNKDADGNFWQLDAIRRRLLDEQAQDRAAIRDANALNYGESAYFAWRDKHAIALARAALIGDAMTCRYCGGPHRVDMPQLACILILHEQRQEDRAAIRALDLSDHGGCMSCAKIRREHAAAIARAALREEGTP